MQNIKDKLQRSEKLIASDYLIRPKNYPMSKFDPLNRHNRLFSDEQFAELVKYVIDNQNTRYDANAYSDCVNHNIHILFKCILDDFVALVCAAENGFTDAMKFLLDNTKSHIGYEYNDIGEGCYDEALLFAAENGHTEIVSLLLKNGADVNGTVNRPVNKAQRHRDYWRPIHFAAENGHTETVRLLLDNGAQVNPYPSMSYISTPLHETAKNGHTDTVLLLLEHGADANVKCNGKRASDLTQDESIKQLLLSKEEYKHSRKKDIVKLCAYAAIMPALTLISSITAFFIEKRTKPIPYITITVATIGALASSIILLSLLVVHYYAKKPAQLLENPSSQPAQPDLNPGSTLVHY